MEYTLKKLDRILKIDEIANIHYFNFDSTTKTKMESHPFSELIYIASGSILIESDNYNGPLTKGEFLVHKTNQKHSFKALDNKKIQLIIIGFKCEDEYMDYFSKSPITLNLQEINLLANVVKEGRNFFKPPYDVPLYNMPIKKNQIFGTPQMVEITLEIFFLTLIRRLQVSDVAKKVTQKFQIDEIINFLDNNYKEKITIDDLAFMFCTNRTTICKEFKTKTKMTINEYLLCKKLNKAKELLLQNELSIKEVSEYLNFNSPHYFSYIFKKKEMLTPFEYKKTRTH